MRDIGISHAHATMVRDVVGSEGVFFYVGYEGTNTWTNPRNTGQVHGQQTAWTLSNPVNVQPSSHARLAARSVHVGSRRQDERFPGLRLLRRPALRCIRARPRRSAARAPVVAPGSPAAGR